MFKYEDRGAEQSIRANGLSAQGSAEVGQGMAANRVKGAGHCGNRGPMGKQGRENILGVIHIRKKGQRGQRANQGGRTGGYLHMQQSILGEALLHCLGQGRFFPNLESVPPWNCNGPFLCRPTRLHNAVWSRTRYWANLLCQLFKNTLTQNYIYGGF